MGKTPLALAMLLAAGVAADDGAELARLLDGMASYKGDFEQSVMNRFGEVMQVATGVMHVQRPGRLRWEVRDPYPQLVLADGRSLWVFDPDLEQVSVQPLRTAIAGSPAIFLTSAADVQVQAHYQVRRVEPPADAAARYVLEPRDPASLYRDLTLTFAADGALAGLDIVDHLDQVTRIAFADVAVNPPLAGRLFTFEIPDGVDVIGDVPATASADR